MPTVKHHAVAADSARRFEYVDDKSSKFWEIRVIPEGVEVRYGKIGANGQTQLKPFADAAAALMSAEKLVAEKLKGGYVEQGTVDAAPASTAVAKAAVETSAAKMAPSVAKAAKAVKAAAPVVKSTAPPSRGSAPASGAGQTLSKSLCISGKLPSGRKKSDYEDALRAAGIALVDDVVRGLTYLVLADPASTSSKAQKARALGVQILSEAELSSIATVDDVVDQLQVPEVKVIRSAAVEQQLEQAVALKNKLIDFLSAALRPAAEPGKRKSKKPPKKHDLVQTLELSAEAWQPIVEEVSVTDLDRTQSMLAGPFFTSAEYPIPSGKHGMLMPVAQLDLRQLALLGQPALGDGLFQLWCDSVFAASPREVIRMIPRADVRPQALTSFALVTPEFDVTPIGWDVVYDPDAKTVKAIVGYESLGMQCQTGYLDVYTEGLDEEIYDAIFEDLKKYEEITSFTSRDVQVFGSFYPIQYSAADIGVPCLICFRSWGSDGNAQVFYAGDSVDGLWFGFEESLR